MNVTGASTVHELDPLTDPRWLRFIGRQPRASVFHTPGWLRALQATYEYKPVVFTTSSPGAELSDGIVFCQIKSWLTGSRIVSLPFSDHCEPLAEDERLHAILRWLAVGGAGHWKYIELRPVLHLEPAEALSPFRRSSSFGFHQINLRPTLDAIYRNFHDSCIRRKIKRAQKEKLTYENGRTEELLQKFRHLLVLTRRRHKLPPQPVNWFRNVLRYMGEQSSVHVLSRDAQPIASIITLRYGKSLVYKYGCSDARFHNLGGMPLLFWMVIQDAKEHGTETFDLGRSAPDDPGLTSFKEHLGAITSQLHYYRYPTPRAGGWRLTESVSWMQEVFARLPQPVFTGAGKLLYRHLG